MTEFKEGDGKNFDSNWRKTEEANYLHWTRGNPQNQIQLAFRNHWYTFNEILTSYGVAGKVLEVGCGRGSLSAYFADAGWDCTLLDISPKAIELAKNAFDSAGLKATFDVGDCLSLPYAENEFEAIFSIGLLEHFEKIETVISEQVRVLAPGGVFIGYVVPKFEKNIQSDFDWINEVLKETLDESLKAGANAKQEIYRSDNLSPPYLSAMSDLGLLDCQAYGTYPLPMISHSIEFPFTLLPQSAERVLVKKFSEELETRRETSPRKNPWLCEEGFGQAFLVIGRKPS